MNFIKNLIDKLTKVLDILRPIRCTYGVPVNNLDVLDEEVGL